MMIGLHRNSIDLEFVAAPYVDTIVDCVREDHVVISLLCVHKKQPHCRVHCRQGCCAAIP